MNSSVSANYPTLTPVQAKVVDALAEGCTITGATAHAGVHRDTFYKWLESSRAFVDAIEQARAERNLTVDDSLSDMSVLALNALRDLLQPDTPRPLRLRAALALLARSQSPVRGWCNGSQFSPA